MYEFRFDPVLRHRENIEKNHIYDMSKLQTSLTEEERVLALSIDQVRKILAYIARAENQGIRPNELAMYRTFLGSARVHMSDQEKKIINIQESIENKRLELINASKEKKVLEKFKQKNKQKFVFERNKKEQKEMDEIATKMYLGR